MAAEKTSRTVWTISCLIVAAALALPWVWPFMFRLGVPATPTVAGISIEMGGGWFPVISEDTNGKREWFLFSAADKKSVVYAKCTFGFINCINLAVFKTKRSDRVFAQGTFVDRRYPWGTARILDSDTAVRIYGKAHDQYTTFVVEVDDSWLVFFAPDLDVLDHMKSITRARFP